MKEVILIAPLRPPARPPGVVAGHRGWGPRRTRSFKKKARVHVEFKNDRLTTRGITAGALMLRPWNLVLPIRHELGLYDRTQMENLRYTFTYQSDVSSKGALSWTAATLFNAVDEMYTYCAATSLPTPPKGLNVMLFSHLVDGSIAPLLKQQASNSVVLLFVEKLLDKALGVPFLGKAISKIVQRQLPDLLCGYGGSGNRTRLTDEQDKMYFKELGHSVHYGQVGDWYWNQYVGYLAFAAVDVNPVLPYGRKTSAGAGLISLTEGWSRYIGNTFTARKYEPFNFLIQNANRAELENQTPNSNPNDADSWIAYGMLHDMTDTGEPGFTGVTDNVNSYTTVQLFRGLESDVNEVAEYQRRLLSQNGNRQLAEMNQLLTSYRW